METITTIQILKNFRLSNKGHFKGDNGSRIGLAQMINQSFGGISSYDGYLIITTEHKYHLLIDNGQSCCEDWGYFDSNDNFVDFVGAEINDVKVTDVALNAKKISERFAYGFDSGGIQFVDFETSNGILQFAVYNEHNGYYGHPIIFAKDNEILLSNTL